MEEQGAQITTNRAHHHQQPYNGGGGGGGGREDCWSEGATATLVEAWGDRYLQLSRGNLRQKDWKEVADAVNAREDGVKPPRTDVQCKNRVDTLKKKYKLEKAKPIPSKWPFYSHLDHLIGPTTSASASASATKKIKPRTSSPSPATVHKSPAVTFTVKNLKEKLNSNHSHNSHNPSPMAASAAAAAGGYSGGSSSKRSSGSSGDRDGGGDDDVLFDGGGGRKRRVVEDSSSDGAAGFRELARAVLKFGEIYERIETSKQQQMMELERQRMEVMKDVEFQRMQMFMETQLDLEKLKRPPKYSSGTGERQS